MAAYSHHRAGSRTSLLNGSGSAEQELPSGSCNFRDASVGARAPVCGCQRFWLNVAHYNGHENGTERAWCFCGHHACFHNAFSHQQRVQEQPLATGRVIASDIVGNTNDNGEHGNPTARQTASPPKQLAGLGIMPDSRSQSQSINTRVWRALNDFARNQEDGGMSDTTSKLPSTAAPSLVEEARLSPNRIIQERLQQYRQMAPPVIIPSAPAARPAEEYSATEVATPSIAGTPDFRALPSSSHNTRTSPGHLQPSRLNNGNTRTVATVQQAQAADSTPTSEEQPTASSRTLSALDIQNVVRDYGHRLQVLESLSFSHVPIEELSDRFELFDGRILDLEQWRTDYEQLHDSPEPAKATSSKRRRLLPTEASSFGSDISFDRDAAAQTEAAVLATLAANAETHPRIDALESRIENLENSAPPSFARPWQVQVVLLPWGEELRGIWFSSAEATQNSLRSTTQQSEEWTDAQSAPKLSFKSTAGGAWTTESIQAWAKDAQDWLSPKACGPSGTVFQRLASRGLVREISIVASDARHILNSITSAFGEVMIDGTTAGSMDRNEYQALRELFIPLRKVRKSSRLRFLSPAEMVTSASWTAGFLDASVFMKVNEGQRRLYLTTPAAYLQADDARWTWQTIRKLPIFDATGEEKAAQMNNVAIEACWTYNEQLDQPMSLHSSFASNESQWSIKSQLADHDAEEVYRRPISPLSDARRPHYRTVSLPSSSSAAEQAKEALNKRRVASFEGSATLPNHAYEVGAEFVAKRRRISVSPEAERRGVNFTPRWSREPPSPFTSEAAAEGRSQGTSSRKRGTTPFAYATPHSNSHYVGNAEFVSGDGDTEADTDIVVGHSDRAEDEWEGVDDGNANAQERQIDNESAADEADIDEDDLDEGLTIYED